MNRARIFLLLPLLAVAACATEKKPITGFDMQPSGSFLLDPINKGGALQVWPLFAMPPPGTYRFRLQLNGQDAVRLGSQRQGIYDYADLFIYNWGGWQVTEFPGIPPATYVVELVDSAGQSWGQSAPLPVPENSSDSAPTPSDPGPQLPTVVFAHFDGRAGSWTIDPATQDADPATDEITVSNLISEDVVVERCLIVSGSRTSCTPVGTIAPGAELRTVETLASLTDASVTAASIPDHQALFIHSASDASESESYQRDLVQRSTSVGNCEIERIVVHGTHLYPDMQDFTTPFALSSCVGYQGMGY